MNTRELVKELQPKIEEVVETKINQDQSRAILDLVFNTIAEGLITGAGKVDVTGFGKFEKVERSARKGRNPQTGEEIQIEASNVPKFKPAKALKDKVKG